MHAAGSPIYDFIRDGKLELPLHDRRRMSGQVRSAAAAQCQDPSCHGCSARLHGPSVSASLLQVETSGRNWRAMQQQFLAQQRQQQQQLRLSDGAGAGVCDAWPGQPPPLVVNAAAIVPPYAPPAVGPEWRSSSGRRSMRPWSAEDVLLAAGSSHGGTSIARHPLQLESAYRAVTGSEAAYSTCHDK